jgi:hypothetical protein
LETKDPEEEGRRNAVRQTEQERVRKGHELSEYQIAEGYLLKKIRETKFDIRRSKRIQFRQ